MKWCFMKNFYDQFHVKVQSSFVNFLRRQGLSLNSCFCREFSDPESNEFSGDELCYRVSVV